MFVYKSCWQEIEDGDIVKLPSWEYYIVAYYMDICSFILYPLGWHSLIRKLIPVLDDDEDWEHVWNISDYNITDKIKIEWWIDFYLYTMKNILWKSME